jgi:phosphate uptake regulator
MIRRLVKHGPSTLIVSVPASWVKKMDLQAGRDVHIEEDQNSLILSVDGNKRKDSTVVDITRLDRTSVIYLMHALYREGFAHITLTFDKPETIHFRTQKKISYSKLIHSFINRFIGFEIAKETKKRIEITQVSYIDKDEIDTIVNRTFILLEDMIKVFCTGVTKHHKDDLSNIEDKHDSITRLISYLLRAIMRGDYSDKSKSYAMSHTLASVDKIIDVLKYVAREKMNDKKKISRQLIPLVDLFQSSFVGYVKLMRKFDHALVRDISEKRDEFKRQLTAIQESLSVSDVRLASALSQALELLYDLIEWRMHLWVLSRATTVDFAR